MGTLIFRLYFPLFLVLYFSAKVCEEKLRYAAYNCVAIDTDMSPWEEWSPYCFTDRCTRHNSLLDADIFPTFITITSQMPNNQQLYIINNFMETWKSLTVVFVNLFCAEVGKRKNSSSYLKQNRQNSEYF